MTNMSPQERTVYEVRSMRLNFIDPETGHLRIKTIETYDTERKATERADLYQRFWAKAPDTQKVPVLFFVASRQIIVR